MICEILWVWSGSNASSGPTEDSESADRSSFFINGVVWILIYLSRDRNAPLDDVRDVVSRTEAGRQDEFRVGNVFCQNSFFNRSEILNDNPIDLVRVE